MLEYTVLLFIVGRLKQTRENYRYVLEFSSGPQFEFPYSLMTTDMT